MAGREAVLVIDRRRLIGEVLLLSFLNCRPPSPAVFLMRFFFRIPANPGHFPRPAMSHCAILRRLLGFCTVTLGDYTLSATSWPSRCQLERIFSRFASQRVATPFLPPSKTVPLAAVSAFFCPFWRRIWPTAPAGRRTTSAPTVSNPVRFLFTDWQRFFPPILSVFLTFDSRSSPRLYAFLDALGPAILIRVWLVSSRSSYGFCVRSVSLFLGPLVEVFKVFFGLLPLFPNRLISVPCLVSFFLASSGTATRCSLSEHVPPWALGPQSRRYFFGLFGLRGSGTLRMGVHHLQGGERIFLLVRRLEWWFFRSCHSRWSYYAAAIFLLLGVFLLIAWALGKGFWPCSHVVLSPASFLLCARGRPPVLNARQRSTPLLRRFFLSRFTSLTARPWFPSLFVPRQSGPHEAFSEGPKSSVSNPPRVLPNNPPSALFTWLVRRRLPPSKLRAFSSRRLQLLAFRWSATS